MIQHFVCKYCNKPFSRQVYKSSNGTFEFCSPICRNKARTLPNVPCPICGKMFRPIINDTKKDGKGCVRKRYCSKKCAWKSQKGKPSNSPYKHTKQEREFIRKFYPEKGAEWCSKKLGWTKSAVANMANKIGVKLTRKVYYQKVHKAAQKYMTGNKNPNWHGGKTCAEWGKNWFEQRKACLKRDNKTCQICGCRALSVHHIIPRRMFAGHVEDANILSNLVTLCRPHHIMVEIGKIKLPSHN